MVERIELNAFSGRVQHLDAPLVGRLPNPLQHEVRGILGAAGTICGFAVNHRFQPLERPVQSAHVPQRAPQRLVGVAPGGLPEDSGLIWRNGLFGWRLLAVTRRFQSRRRRQFRSVLTQRRPRGRIQRRHEADELLVQKQASIRRRGIAKKLGNFLFELRAVMSR